MFRSLMVLGITIALCGCAAQTAAPDPAGTGALQPSRAGGGPCASKRGVENRNAPIVCVDDTGSTLTVHPDPIRMHDVGQNDRLPVMLQWHTVSGRNDLRVEIEPGCVTEVKCERPGHCSARSMPRADKTEKRCKYDVWTDRHPRLDPDVIITPCC